MSIRDATVEMPDILPVRHVLASVFYKNGLRELVVGLSEANPEVMFYSSTGTHTKIAEFLGEKAATNLMQIGDYSSVPEMEGGLVKTLVPHVHAGLLGENNNSAHQDYMKLLSLRLVHSETREPIDLSKTRPGDYLPVQVVEAKHPVVPIDLLVVNFYDFDKAVSAEGTTPEKARGHIDIGGPSMVRGAAKNFMNTAVVVDPSDYGAVIGEVKSKGGITFETRLDLAKKVFATTHSYDLAISAHFSKLSAADFRACYKFEGGK